MMYTQVAGDGRILTEIPKGRGTITSDIYSDRQNFYAIL